MQRYFVDTVDHDTDHFIISGENARHISKVMRMTAGEEIIVVHDNVAYICEIIELDQDVHAKKTGVTIPSPEMPVDVDIACGLPKGDKLELIAQKATELGMHALIPFAAERSIVKWDEKKRRKTRNVCKKSPRKRPSNRTVHMSRKLYNQSVSNSLYKLSLTMTLYILPMKKMQNWRHEQHLNKSCNR